MADFLKLRRNVRNYVESETWVPETFQAWFRVSVNRPSAGQRLRPTPKHPATHGFLLAFLDLTMHNVQ